MPVFCCRRRKRTVEGDPKKIDGSNLHDDKRVLGPNNPPKGGSGRINGAEKKPEPTQLVWEPSASSSKSSNKKIKGDLGSNGSEWRQNRTILVLGLSGCGKTSLVNLVCNGVPMLPPPTRSPSEHPFELKYGEDYFLLDFPGRDPDIWTSQSSLASKRIYATIFLIDGTDSLRIKVARQELHRLVSIPGVKNAPLLILFNKKDMPMFLPWKENLVEKLDFPLLNHKNWTQLECTMAEEKSIISVKQWLQEPILEHEEEY